MLHKTLLSALTATVILSGTASAKSVDAMTPTTPSARNAASVNSVQIQVAAVVCGSGGCVPVQTKPRQKRKLKVLGHG